MDLEERIKKIIVDQLGVKPEEVTAKARFVDDLGTDSLDTVELVMRFEEEFNLEIPDEDTEETGRKMYISYVVDWKRYKEEEKRRKQAERN